jgi:hypothetical protein
MESYFDEKEGEFLNKIFLYMDETPAKEINLKSFENFLKTDENIIKRTKEKLNTIIQKYNLVGIQKIFQEEFIPLKNSNETSVDDSNNLQPTIFKNNLLKSVLTKEQMPVPNEEITVYNGGSAATTGKGGAALAKLLLQNINSHGIILGSTITFIEFIFIMIFVRVFIFLLDGFHEGNLTESIRNILNISFQKLITFYYRLRFLILNETIVIENYREIIDLPYSEITHFPADTQNAVLIHENREGQLKQRLDSLLAQYNSSQDYRIYSNLSYAEKNKLLRTINQIENELADLLQPAELVYMEELPNTSVTNGNFDARNDIVAVPVQATNGTKNIFKFFLRFCLIHYNDNTRTGGRTKSRTNKRKTNNKNKKRKNRTKRNKRNFRSA